MNVLRRYRSTSVLVLQKIHTTLMQELVVLFHQGKHHHKTSMSIFEVRIIQSQDVEMSNWKFWLRVARCVHVFRLVVFHKRKKMTRNRTKFGNRNKGIPGNTVKSGYFLHSKQQNSTIFMLVTLKFVHIYTRQYSFTYISVR